MAGYGKSKRRREVQGGRRASGAGGLSISTLPVPGTQETLKKDVEKVAVNRLPSPSNAFLTPEGKGRQAGREGAAADDAENGRKEKECAPNAGKCLIYFQCRRSE